jgi:cellulose synthase operon protein C
VSDPKDKLPPENAKGTEGVFGGVDEDEWLAAVDEWDSKLDLPAAPPVVQTAPPSAVIEPAAPAAPPSPPSPPKPQYAHDDPLVNLVSGDLEIPEGEGEALGSLLGSTPPALEEIEEARRRYPTGEHRAAAPAAPVTAGPPTDDEVFAGTEGVWAEMSPPPPEAELEFGAPQASIDRTSTVTVDQALLRSTLAPAGDFGAEGATRIVAVDDEFLKKAAQGEERPAPLPAPPGPPSVAPPPALDDFYDGIEIEAAPADEVELPGMLAGLVTPAPAGVLEPEELDFDHRGREGERTPVPGAPPAVVAAPPPPAADEAELEFLPPDEDALGTGEEPPIEEAAEPATQVEAPAPQPSIEEAAAAAAEAAAVPEPPPFEAAPPPDEELIFGEVDALLSGPVSRAMAAAPSGPEAQERPEGEPGLQIVEPEVEAELEAEFPEALGLRTGPAAPPVSPAAILAALAGEGEPEPTPPPPPPVVQLRPEALALPEEPVPADAAAFDEAYWRQQAELFVAELHLAEEPARAAALAYSAARIHGRRLGDSSGELDLLEQARGRDPHHLPTLRALRHLHARRGAWDDALAALDQEAALLTAEERAALIAYRGDVLLARGDGAGARAAFEQLLAARPNDARARLALCDLAVIGEASAQGSRAEQLLQALEQAAAVTDPVLAAELGLEEARLHEALGREEQARSRYRKLLDEDPGRPGAALGLWRSALRARAHEEAAELEARLADLVPAAAAPLRRHEAVTRLLRLKDPANARVAAEAAAAAAPEEPFVLSTLADVLAGFDDAGFAAALDRLAAAETDTGLRAATHLRAAEVRETRLTDAAGAAASVERALAAAPDLIPAQLALERLSARGEPERQLAIARGAALTDPERAPYLRLVAARLLSRVLGRPDEAVAELSLALKASPGYAAALREQLRLLTESGRHHDAAEVLDQAAAAVEEERPAEAAFHRETAAALAGRGVDGEVEERARLDAICAGEAPPALRWARVAAHLATGGHAAIVPALAVEAEAAGEEAHGAALWHLRARLLDAETPAEAAESERQALALCAHHAAAHSGLLRRTLAAGATADAAALLRARAIAVSAHARQETGSTEAPPESAALFLRAGLLLEASEPAQAAAALDEALALPTAPRQAREALARVARATGDAARAATLLGAELEETTDPVQRFALLLALADAHSQAGDASRAAERAKLALAAQPGHPFAQAALQALYLQTRNFAALAEFSFEDLKHAETPAAKVAAYERLAEIDADQRGDVHSAILGYETILELDPANAPTLRTLERYYLTQERWAELATTLGRLGQALQATHPALAAEFHLERARLTEVKLAAAGAETPPSLELARPAIAAMPRSLRALRRMDVAARTSKDQEALLEVTLRLADTLADDGRAAAICLTRAAEVSGALGRTDEALRLFSDATSRSPGFLPAWHGLRRLTLSREAWPQVAAAAEGEGAALRDPGLRAEAYLLAGSVCQERLQDPARAATCFAHVLEAEPTNDTAFLRLRGLYAAREQWPELASLLRQRTEIDTEPPKLTELHFALAEALRDHLGDRVQAKAQLKLALHHTPQSPRALQALSAMYWEDGEWAEAAEVLIRRLRVERERGVLKEVLFRLGVIYADKLPDVKRAVAAFSRVLQVDPENREALRYLADQHLKDGNWKEAHTTTARLAALEPETDKKVGHMLRLARIVDEGFKDQRRATDLYRKAQEVDPFSLLAVQEFARFYERQGDLRSAHVHLDTAITRFRTLLHQDPFDVRAYAGLFQIFGWRGDPDRAHTSAQILGSLGGTDEHVLAYLQQVGPTVEPAGGALAEPMVDDLLFPSTVPAGFRQLFRLLAEPLDKAYKPDLKPYNLRREERLPRAAHPIRDIANRIAEALRLGEFDVYVSSGQPNALALENADPPSIIIGANVVKGATPEELRFALGVKLKMLQLKLELPTRLPPRELGLLVSGIVRQFIPDFAPGAYPENMIVAEASRVGRAIPRKMHQEIMPFALECAGAIDWDALVMDLVHVGNRAGLLLSGSLGAALTVLRKVAGHGGILSTPADFARTCRGNRQIEELLRFAVSQEYLELRRQLGIALG